MKLIFKIEKDTGMGSPALIDKIALQLTDLRYEILEKKDSHVSFKDSDKYGMSALRMSAFSKADKGIFEIVEIGNRRYVKLTYYMSVTEEIILFSSLILIGPFYDFYPWFGVVLFFIIFLFRILSSKMQWKETLDRTVNEG
jgi:hypothetical protein